jgi:cholesterol transport system auxiliary component
VLFLAGCSFFPPPAAVHDFGYMQPTVSQTSVIEGFRPVITVEAPKWMYDKRIRYRFMYVDPTQIRFYTLDRWLASPPELFEQLIVANNQAIQHPLTVNLKVFEQQFTVPGMAKVIVEFKVTQYTVDKDKVINEQDFKLEEPCATADARGAVKAFAVLVRKAVKEIQRFG